MLPHLGAAYNLARWLLRNEADARDVVQDSFLRAWRSFGSYRGDAAGSARAWLLTIVRNTAHTFRNRDRARLAKESSFDESAHAMDASPPPDAKMIRAADHAILRAAIEKLPHVLREAIVLRELQEMSYKEIADVVGVPIGTVMSRIARARAQLMQSLAACGGQP